MTDPLIGTDAERALAANPELTANIERAIQNPGSLGSRERPRRKTEPKLLGPEDEPRTSGAVVAVHWGDYRLQEIWVASGANVGAWYPLGGEFWVVFTRQAMPPGVNTPHPTWSDVLKRGPVVLLTATTDEAYDHGWRIGRRNLVDEMEDLIYDDPRR